MALNSDYETLRLDMQTLFNDLGISTKTAAAYIEHFGLSVDDWMIVVQDSARRACAQVISEAR